MGQCQSSRPVLAHHPDPQDDSTAPAALHHMPGRLSRSRSSRVHATPLDQPPPTESGASSSTAAGGFLRLRRGIAARDNALAACAHPRHSTNSSGADSTDRAIQVNYKELLLGGQSQLPCRPARWRKGDSIGAGSFGTVFMGLNCDTGELLAVKEVAMNVEGAYMKEAMEQLEQELALLSRLDHPNIVRYLGTSREASSLFIFLEYVPGGSIASLVAKFGPLEEAVIRVYTRQLLAGLAYLHAMRTVHRDVKGANLLVEKDGHVKLADFGMAKQMVEAASFTKSFKGSAFWMAPEVIRQQGHGVAADIWSVGCTVLEMATGKPPWSQCSTQVQAIFKIASAQELPAIPESLSPEASEFVLLCLQRDPQARPSAEALLRHAFVAGLDPGVVPALRDPLALTFVAPLAAAARAATGQGAGSSAGNTGLGEGAGARQMKMSAAGRVLALRRLSAQPTLPQAQQHRQQHHPQHMGGDAKAEPAGEAAAATTINVRRPSHSQRGTEDDASERLAALVLGISTGPSRQHGAEPLCSSSSIGGGGLWLEQQRLERPSSLGHFSRARSGAEEEDAGIDFSSQPALFRVRGLLSLPPLKVPQGQELPVVKFQALMQAHGPQSDRPGTASTVTSHV